jgi:hypothetical protein
VYLLRHEPVASSRSQARSPDAGKHFPQAIRVGPDGRLSLEPLRKLQAAMPLTPSVIEDCRGGERW